MIKLRAGFTKFFAGPKSVIWSGDIAALVATSPSGRGCAKNFDSPWTTFQVVPT